MRSLIHTGSFGVFCLAFTVGAVAVLARLLAAMPIGQATDGILADHGRISAVASVCAIVAVAAYTVGWFTTPEPWDETAACPVCVGHGTHSQVEAGPCEECGGTGLA